jgi:hypothetical protein
VLRGTKQHIGLELFKLRNKFGNIVTFWIGNRAFIIVFDSEIARDIFKLNAFSGRPKVFFGKKLLIIK